MRKIYGNIERDKIKKFNSVKDLSENKIDTNYQSNSNHTRNTPKNMLILNNLEIKNVDANKLNVKTMKPLNKERKKSTNQKIELQADSEKDIESFIRHLKCLLREKSAQLKQSHFPSLCQCNTNQASLWENDWSQCANNCYFYKNPKGIQISYNFCL